MTDGIPGKPAADADADAGRVDDGRSLLVAVEYGDQADAFFWNAIEYVARSLDPLYAAMSTGDRDDETDGVTVEVDGKSVGSPQVKINYDIPIYPADVRDTNLEALHAAIHEAALSKLEQAKDPYGAYLDAALDAVGNNLKLSKETFGWDTVLDMLEKVEWPEGADGQVHPPRQLAGAAVPDLPEMTAEQEIRRDQIYDQKQEEHVARRRNRRLR